MSFLRDTGMTPEIVKMMSDIVKNSRSSFKERKERGQRFYQLLRDARVRRAEQEVASVGKERH